MPGRQIAAHAMFALAVFTTMGRWIDYVPDFDLFTTFFGWAFSRTRTLPVNKNDPWWVPVWLAIFLTLARAAAAALRGISVHLSKPISADRVVTA